LDALATRWLGTAKDKVASKFTVSLSKYDDIADSPPPAAPELAILEKNERARARTAQLKEWRKRPAAERRQAVMRIVTDYCGSDVNVMVHGWPRLEPYLRDGVFGGWEKDVLAVDGIVNDRGVCFDSDLARRLLAADEANRERAIEAAAKVCGWSTEEVRRTVGSPQQFTRATGRADATAETVDSIIAGAGFEDPAIVALAEARRALATIARGKLEAGLARVSPDGRLRDSHRYYGAHTGRWSGRGMQLQNFPRPSGRFEKWGDDEICRYLAGERVPDKSGKPTEWGDVDAIMVALRACLTASPGNELAVCDFSGVEARWLAWTAGDSKALEVFRSGRNPYFVAAATIFGVRYEDIVKGSDQYDIGKKAELGCGYGMGPKKFELNYQPSRVGVDAADVVRGWRELHAPIVQYWRALEDAFVAAIRGQATRVWPYDFVPSTDGRDVAVFLPSGRPVVYNAVGFSREIGFNGRERMSPYYIGTKSGREHLYGGKIAENLTQAGCRDLMAEALVAAEAAGLCPVLHVHDEVVCDAPRGEETYAELKRIMTTLPEWAEGFPVGAAGHWGKRYRK
jgi:DNA polymerase